MPREEVFMPGFEIFGEEERTQVGHVLETGVLFRGIGNGGISEIP